MKTSSRFSNHFALKQLAAIVGLLSLASLNTYAAIVNVYNGQDLQNALKNAKAGDEIVLQPGSYKSVPGTPTAGEKDSHFYSAANGTASNRIILRSASASNPQALTGDTTESKKILYILGDYWTIKDITVTNGRVGMMFDNANYNIVDRVTVFNIGQEGIHLRDNSSNNVVKNSRVYNTGLKNPGTGEAFYVGSDPKSAAEYGYGMACNNNVIGGNTTGPGVAAEHIDIKEGTSGTIFEYNTMNGQGIVGDNSADSLVDIKGNKSVIRGNKADRNGDSTIKNAYELHGETTSTEATFIDNTGDLDGGSGSLIYAHQGKAHINSGNRRTDGGSPLTSKTSRATIDSNIPAGIPAPGNYGSGGGSSSLPPLSSSSSSIRSSVAPSSVSSSSATPSSVSSSSVAPSSRSSSSSSVATSGCSSTQNVAWDTRAELTVSNGSCIKFSQNLSGKNLQVWDSDTNTSCDYAGTISSVDGSGNLVVNTSYVTSTSLSGTTFKFTHSASCNFVKVRAF